MERKKITVGSIATFIIMAVFAIVCLYPVLWLLVNSLKSNDELFTNPWNFPLQLHWDNYSRAIVSGNIGKSFLNSIIITGIAVLIAVILSAMTSYGIVRLNWKFSKVTQSFFLLGMSIPSYAAIVPLFAMFNRLGWLNSYMGVIIAHISFAFPLSIFILSGFFSTLPKEIEEAAIIDGCSVFKQFFRIIMPVSVSSVVTVAVIDFINIWNDLLFPQIFLSDPNSMPLPVALTMFADLDGVDYVGMLAAVVFTVVPTIVVYIILHDKIMDGMTAGAVKG